MPKLTAKNFFNPLGVKNPVGRGAGGGATTGAVLFAAPVAAATVSVGAVGGALLIVPYVGLITCTGAFVIGGVLTTAAAATGAAIGGTTGAIGGACYMGGKSIYNANKGP